MNIDSNPYKDFKSGFAVIAGAPNAGKSTLLNAMIGQKISITSEKPQTTRNRIAGIVHGQKSQIIFIDTPGIHDSKKVFNKRIVDVALSAIDDMDMVLVVADAARPDPASEELIIRKLRKRKRVSAILALNKIDLVPGPAILTQIDQWARRMDFEEIVPVSAAKGTQVEELVAEMARRLPEGPPYFPEDSITDVPERFIAAEIIREKIFRLTGQEIPYSTAVTIEEFSTDPSTGLVRILAVIHVERSSQKGIIIGKQGSLLKKIGTQARAEIKRMVGAKVFLELFVRVEKNWSKDTRALRRLGY
ncbi:MAG: GTPase Era [Deltaproteobacteria bacterium]|nr:GTPase Era [Deltaproteobacteria bacterium]